MCTTNWRSLRLNLAVFLVATAALHAQSPAAVPATAVTAPPMQPGATYAGGQLTLQFTEASVSEILAKVAAATGISVVIPPDAERPIIPFVRLGPGSPRQILGALLRDARVNFVIESSASDPEKLATVLLIAPDKSDNRGPDRTSPREVSRPVAPPAAQPTDIAQANGATGVETDGAARAASSPSDDSAQPAPDGDTSARTAPAATQEPGVRTTQLTPPPVLNQQSISQQLQQMYQQRIQMIQQGRQGTAAQPAAGSTP